MADDNEESIVVVNHRVARNDVHHTMRRTERDHQPQPPPRAPAAAMAQQQQQQYGMSTVMENGEFPSSVHMCFPRVWRAFLISAMVKFFCPAKL